MATAQHIGGKSGRGMGASVWRVTDGGSFEVIRHRDSRFGLEVLAYQLDRCGIPIDFVKLDGSKWGDHTHEEIAASVAEAWD